MELVVSEEQRELRGTLRRFFADRSPSGEVRRLMESPEGYDPGVWRQMGEQLGLQGLAIPEEYGGAGFGFRELVIVMEEMGRMLVCAPYLSSAVLAAGALLLSGDEVAKRELLPGIAAGATIATLAFTEETGRWDAAGIEMTARHGQTFEAHPANPEGGWVLDGVKSYVLDGQVADVILVVAHSTAGSGLSLFAVEAGAPGLSLTALPTFDQTRRLARLAFAGVPGRLVGREGGAGEVLEGALARAAVALAAEQLGGAQRVLETSVEYAKVRQQFGRPIGSFQAIKHRCADLLVEVESSRSAVMHAAAVADEDPAQLPAAAALAQAYCSDAYFHAAGETIQIHGGIGFTWEHDTHLYFKRAKSSQAFLGDSAYHRAALATHLGFGPGGGQP